MLDARDQCIGITIAQERPIGLLNPTDVIRMELLYDLPADQFLGLEPEDGRHRRRDILAAKVQVDLEDDIGSVLDQQSIPGLAFPQRAFGIDTRTDLAGGQTDQEHAQNPDPACQDIAGRVVRMGVFGLVLKGVLYGRDIAALRRGDRASGTA